MFFCFQYSVLNIPFSFASTAKDLQTILHSINTSRACVGNSDEKFQELIKHKLESQEPSSM